MEKKMTKAQMVARILADVKQDLKDEEIVELLLDRKVSVNINRKDEKYTFGQRAADKLAGFAGSWPFIIIFFIILLVWIGVNLFFLSKPFDPYPFILLNLVLSCLASIQAPLIMMSQNRQEQKDRLRAENDYKVNLKTEIIIEDLHRKMQKILKEQEEIKKLLPKDGGTK